VIEVAIERSRPDGSLDHVFRSQPVSWQLFHQFRNALLQSLRRFGTVGPMGEAPITSESDGPPQEWAIECDNPQFYVVDDQWHDTVLDIKIECEPALVTGDVLHELLKVTSRWKGSLVIVALTEDSNLAVATGRILVRGPLFPEGCESIQGVAGACARYGTEVPDRGA
jgi:hypothetical protein